MLVNVIGLVLVDVVSLVEVDRLLKRYYLPLPLQFEELGDRLHDDGGMWQGLNSNSVSDVGSASEIDYLMGKSG